MITFDNVSKSFGGQDIVSGGSFHVSAGDRIGLVGRNGAGKTTLLRMLLGREAPDGGRIHRAKNLSLGHLPQEVSSLGQEPLIDLVMSMAGDVQRIEKELAVVAEELEAGPSPEELDALVRRQSRLLESYERFDGYSLQARAEKVLAGLGFRETDFQRPVDEFSGGWRMRALLARILLADPDLILLDEPTNHLDLDSMLWLENYLTNLTAAVIIISHDRAFLDRTVRRIIELDRAALTVFNGGYGQYEVEKAQRIRHRMSAYQSQQEQIKQIQNFIDRNRSRKDRAKQVQGRIKALEKIDRIEPPTENREFTFTFPRTDRPPTRMVSLDKVEFSYPGGEPVYRGLTVDVRRADRAALVGPNGAGKSSLLKLLAGENQPTAGRRDMGPGVRVAYFAQHQLDQLHPDMTIIEELMSVSGQATQTEMRTILGNFLFHGDDVLKKVKVLSGGEKSRLVLAKLLYSGANLLLLDEPTNHLDIPARIALEQALKAWPGAMCLVSHDRLLIDAVANVIWEIVPGGTVNVYPGDLNDYMVTWQKLAQNESEETEPTAKESDPVKESSKESAKERRRREAEQRQRLHRETKGLKAELERVEKKASGKESEIDDLTAQLADPEVYQNPDRSAQVGQGLKQAKADLAELNDRWAELAVELEEIAEQMAD